MTDSETFPATHLLSIIVQPEGVFGAAVAIIPPVCVFLRRPMMNQDPATSSALPGATAESDKKPRGAVSIIVERCKGCGFCVAFCPSGVLELSTGFNDKGYHHPEVAHPEKCTGCDMCGMYCPDFAICGARLPRSEAERKE